MEDEEESTEGTLGALRDQLGELVDPSTTEEAQVYARKFLNKQLNSPIAGKQNELLTEMEKNAEEARAVLRAAREKLMARRFNPADKWYALSKALGAPTRVGGIGELASRAAGALGESADRREKFTEGQEKEALGYDAQMAAIRERLLALKSGVLTGQGKVDADLARESLKTLGKRVGANTATNKAQQAVDREYAKDYVEWVQGGAPSAKKSLEELDQAKSRLLGYTTGPNGERVPIKEDDFLTRKLGPTGRVSGAIATVPFVGKGAQDLLMPGSADIREIVEATVQGSLRPILGAQFTEKEGERLIARVYNPRLRPEVNAARVGRLVAQLREAAENRDRAAKWFEEHGTLHGFKGRWEYSIKDFEPTPLNELVPSKDTGEVNDEEMPGRYQPQAADDEPAGGGPSSTVRTAPDGRRIYKVDELPKKKKNFLGFAEGGAVAGPSIATDTIWVELPDGTLKEVAADATQEDVLAADDRGSYDSAASRASLAALGAGIGYGSGRLLSGTANRAADLLPGRKETSAEARLLRLLERSGKSPGDVVSGVKRASRAGVPAMALDESPDLVSLGRNAMTHGGSEAQDMLDRLLKRQAGSRERATEQVNRGLKPDEYFGKEDQLKEKLYGKKDAQGNIVEKSESGKLYDEAFAENPALRSKQLMKLLDTPTGQKAVKEARKRFEDRGLPIGKQNKITGAVEKFSLEFLNEVKKSLNDIISIEEKAGATGKGRVIRDLEGNLRRELDTATTDPSTGKSKYAEARGQWDSDLRHLKALQSGREEFGKMQPEEVRRAVAGMSFEQKDAFRSGVAQKLYETLNNPSTDIAAARRLVGSPAMKAKLATLFDTPAEFRLFETALTKEMEIYENSQKLLGKEDTVRKRGAEPAEGVLARGARKAPTLGVFSPTYWALKILREKPEMGEKEANELIKLLKSQTPEELANFEGNLGRKFGRKTARKKRASKLGAAGAAVGALSGALFGGDDEEDDNEIPEQELVDPLTPDTDPALAGLDEAGIKWANTPAYAEGGKVQKAKEAILALREKHRLEPMDPEILKGRIASIAMNIGELPEKVWKLFLGTDAPAASAATPPVRIPAQPEQLAPFARTMDFEKARLQQIRDSLAVRQMDPATANQMNIGSSAADLAYQRMMSEPTPQNMQTLTELVRGLQQQAERRKMPRKRGGRIGRQFGGMTRHG